MSKKLTKLAYATEVTTEGEGRTVEGLAIVYGTLSGQRGETPQGLPVYHRIAPGAVTPELLATSDVKLTMFHNFEYILGRSDRGEGTLELTPEEGGLRFKCELPDTADGEKARQAVKRRDIKGCSFMGYIAFSDPDAVKYSEEELNGERIAVLTIYRIEELFDVTLTENPAFVDTTVETYSNPAPVEESADETPAPDGGPAPAEETPAAEEDPTAEEAEAAYAEELARETAAALAEYTQPETNQTPTPMNKKKLTELVLASLRENKSTKIVCSYAAGAASTEGGAIVTTTEIEAGGLLPVRPQSLITPLISGIIYDKIGVTVNHSNSGELVWPVRGAASCGIANEKEQIVPKSLDLTKITMRPERFVASYETTYEAIYQSDNAIEGIIQTAMNEAVTAAINKVLLSTDKVAGAVSIQGPLVKAKANAVTLSAVTLKEILTKLKAPLLKKGVDASKLVYTMSEATKAKLEGTVADAGSGRFLIEGDKLAGIPVFATAEIPDDYIGLGDWSCQAAGFFGDMRMLVNPYSGDTANTVRFTLNFGFGTQTLRPEAFIVGKLPA